MAACFHLVAWLSDALVGTPQRLSERSVIARLRTQQHTLEARADRYRSDARQVENTLLTHHLSRGALLEKPLGHHSRERVRLLFTRRNLVIAESIKHDRMALVLERAIITAGAAACARDVLVALDGANTLNSATIDATPDVRDIMDALAVNEDVVARYNDALAEDARDTDVDGRLEELVADASTSAEHIERVAASLYTLADAPPAPRHVPREPLLAHPL